MRLKAKMWSQLCMVWQVLHALYCHMCCVRRRCLLVARAGSKAAPCISTPTRTMAQQLLRGEQLAVVGLTCVCRNSLEYNWGVITLPSYCTF